MAAVVLVVPLVVAATMVLESQSSLFNALLFGSAKVSKAQFVTIVPTGTSDRTWYSTSTKELAPLTSVPNSHVTVLPTTLHTPEKERTA